MRNPKGNNAFSGDNLVSFVFPVNTDTNARAHYLGQYDKWNGKTLFTSSVNRFSKEIFDTCNTCNVTLLKF